MKYLALGGNLGAVLATFRWALDALTEAGVRPVAVSGAYRTLAQVPPDAAASWAPPYWNAVCQVETQLSCEAVLGVCKALEVAAGRVAGPRWAARPLDLDVLLWGHQVYDTAKLSVPHPCLHERLFVLRPLHELAPHAWVPTRHCSVQALLQGFADGWAGILLRRSFWTKPSAQKNGVATRGTQAPQVAAAQGH